MTIGRSYCIVIQVLRKHDAAVAQSVERRIGSAEVTGPIPVSSSSKDVCVAVTIENSLLQPFLF